MRIIETKAYKFNELSDEAKENAINEYRKQGIEYHFQSENSDTLEKFCDIFPVKVTDYSYGGYSHSYINWDYKGDDNARELSGIRLMKYIINNYSRYIYKGKYYSTNLKENREYNHPNIKNKLLSNKKIFHAFYSRIQKDNCCVLTGYCIDDDILQPIYDFLKSPKEHITFEDLLGDCLESWVIACKNDCEHCESDEYITDMIEANDYEFNENGDII